MPISHIDVSIVECMKSQDRLVFRGPHGMEPDDDDPLILCKAIQQKAFSAGQLILRPFMEKQKQLVRKDTMVSKQSYIEMAEGYCI